MRQPKTKTERDRARLAEEAKAIVALALRNGLTEGLHSRISQDEMKRIVKTAMDRVYSLLWFREKNAERYAALLEATKGFHVLAR